MNFVLDLYYYNKKDDKVLENENICLRCLWNSCARNWYRLFYRRNYFQNGKKPD